MPFLFVNQRPCGCTFTSVVHFKFSDLPETVWEIPIPSPPTLSGSLWAMYIIILFKYNICCFATLIILLYRGFLAYLKCLKRYSYPAQCCWTWAVCLLIETFLSLLRLIVWLSVSSANFLSIILSPNYCYVEILYLYCYKGFNYPAQCCWTWAVCLLIETFL